MNENLISVIDAANKLGLNKGHLFKIIKRLGVNTIKQKNSSHKGQAIAYISNEDLDLISRDQVVSGKKFNDSDESVINQLDHGVFYLIVLVKHFHQQFPDTERYKRVSVSP